MPTNDRCWVLEWAMRLTPPTASTSSWSTHKTNSFAESAPIRGEQHESNNSAAPDPCRSIHDGPTRRRPALAHPPIRQFRRLRNANAKDGRQGWDLPHGMISNSGVMTPCCARSERRRRNRAAEQYELATRKQPVEKSEPWASVR